MDKYSSAAVEAVKKKLGISDDKKVILYMPTYREYLRDSNNSCYLAPPIDLEKWERELGDEYVLLIRAHYLVVKELEINQNGFVYDVSKYEYLNDLYAISNVLISDYSSAFFDFAVLERPEFCFAYDIEEYEEKRGLYIDMEQELPCSVDHNEDELIEHIKHMNYDEMCEKTRSFKNKYLPYCGNATDVLIKEIIKRYMS